MYTCFHTQISDSEISSDLTCGCPLKMSPTRYREIVTGMNHKDETFKSDSYTNTSIIDRINFQPPLAPLLERPFEQMSLEACPAYEKKDTGSLQVKNREVNDLPTFDEALKMEIVKTDSSQSKVAKY